MTARHRPWGAADRAVDSIGRMGDEANRENAEHKPARRHSPAILVLRALRTRLLRFIMLSAALCCLVYIMYTFTLGGEAARLQWEKDQHSQLSSWYSPHCGFWLLMEVLHTENMPCATTSRSLRVGSSAEFKRPTNNRTINDTLSAPDTGMPHV